MCSHYGSSKICKLSVNNMQLLTTSFKEIPKLKFQRKPLCKNCLIYHFAAIWSGRFYVLAVKYDSYVILKHCPFKSDECKSVYCKYLDSATQWYIYNELSQISESVYWDFMAFRLLSPDGLNNVILQTFPNL
jgi:hypothetical protein